MPVHWVFTAGIPFCFRFSLQLRVFALFIIKAWFTKVCIWVAVRLACFRAQRSGHRNRNRGCRKADYEHDYEYEHDSYVESCNPELNQAIISQIRLKRCKENENISIILFV